MSYMALLGRVLLSLIFVMAGFGYFTRTTIAFATAQGVPFAAMVIPFAGVVSLLGGLSIALGYKVRWGAWFLVVVLVPLTLVLHNFWTVADPITREMRQLNFMKNLSMLGGTLLIVYFGAGPLSLDARRRASPA